MDLEILRVTPSRKGIKMAHAKNTFGPLCLRAVLLLAFFQLATTLFGRQSDFRFDAFAAVQPAAPLFAGQSNSPAAEQQPSHDPVAAPATAQTPASRTSASQTPPDQTKPGEEAVPESKRQPKRILGIMPNYRAVSAGAIPPPPTLKEAFKIATQNSFDYSAFVFTAMTSGIADAEGAHKQLGDGVAAYWAYYWRGFVDKTDGNYLVIFALPTIFHQDERYYAMGRGASANALSTQPPAFSSPRAITATTASMLRNYWDAPWRKEYRRPTIPVPIAP